MIYAAARLGVVGCSPISLFMTVVYLRIERGVALILRLTWLLLDSACGHW